MSKAVMQYIILVVFFFIICVGISVFLLFQKMAVEKQNEALQGQVLDYEAKQQQLTKDISNLTEKANEVRASLEKKNKEAEDLQKKNSDVRSELDKVSKEIAKVRSDKDDIDSKMKTIRKERDDLMGQVSDLQNIRSERDKLSRRVKELESLPPPPPASVVASVEEAKKAVNKDEEAKEKDEEYLARLEREKAGLLIDLDKVKKDLLDTKLKITDLSKANSDLDVEIGRLKNENEKISQNIKYGEDLADNLSLELARARKDQRITKERATKIDEDNKSLRTEIRQLTSTKVSLEKSISRLTDDKNVIEKKLLETEGIVQSRIDEMWKIKKDIDSRLDIGSVKTGTAQIELPPIVVNANSSSVGNSALSSVPSPAPRVAGSIVSVNEDNNFVVVDIGEKSGLKIGDQLKIYRNGGQIGIVEVIQVRQDISAADIRQKSMMFKPGDVVK